MLSFAIPVYGCPDALALLCDRISAVCKSLSVQFQIILVDDRCPYDSWSVIEKLAERDSAIVGVRLSRNFGQHAAIQAALHYTSGDWIVVMDCDLQDQPEEVPILFKKAQEGYEIVQARRGNRASDHWIRRQSSRLFYNVLGFFTGTDQDPEVANFGIYSRKVINVIKGWEEETKYFPAIVQWVGFSRVTVSVAHSNRFAGRSGYSARKLLRLASNIIVGFSDRPLRLLVSVGIGLSALSFLIAIVVLFLHVTGQIRVEGWASIAISLWFLAGWLTFALGLTGMYVGRILVEAKGRPNYIVDKIISAENLQTPERNSKALYTAAKE